MKAQKIASAIGLWIMVVCAGVYLLFISCRFTLNEMRSVNACIKEKNVVFLNDFRKYGFWAKTFFDGEGSDWRRSGKVSFDDNGIVLKGGHVHNKCEVQSRQRFHYQSLEFMAQADKWKPDTTIGFEYWEGSYHSAIKINDGKLVVINDPAYHSQKDIPNWDKIKDKTNIYRINWLKDKAELLINGKLVVTTSSRDIPSRELLIRFNLSQEANETLRIAYVKVIQSSPRSFGKIYQVSWRMLGGGMRIILGSIPFLYVVGYSIYGFGLMIRKIRKRSIIEPQ